MVDVPSLQPVNIYPDFGVATSVISSPTYNSCVPAVILYEAEPISELDDTTVGCIGESCEYFAKIYGFSYI